MTAYAISEVTILAEERAAIYRELAAASGERHGGRCVARATARPAPPSAEQ